jgi:amino acid adenylation domain-containing protein
MELAGDQDLSSLSDEKRKLLAYLLAEEGVDPLAAPTIPQRADPTDQPLSFAQQQLWLLDQRAPASAAYVIAGAVHLAGPLDMAALARSLNAIVARHEVLRAIFPAVDGQPRVQLLPLQPLPLPLLDIQALPAPRRAQLAQHLADAAARAPFDLARGPLLRIILLRLRASTHILLLALHHIVADGWSLELLLAELAAHYPAQVAGQAATLPALPIQYTDYATWQRTRLQGAFLEAQLSYWKTQLADAPPALALPSEAARTPTADPRGARLTLVLTPATSAALTALGQSAEATLFMTMLAAFQLLLARLSGQDDIVVGAPVAGRTVAPTEALLGCFLNTLVLRTDLSGDPTFRDLLARVRTVCLDAYAHQELPFEQLVAALNPDRRGSQPPLFDVLLNFLSFPHTAAHLPGLTLTRLAPPAPEAKYPLTLYAAMQRDTLQLDLVYQPARFAQAQIHCIMAQLHALLVQIAAAPDQLISTYSLLTPEMQRRLPDPRLVLSTPSYVPAPTLIARWATHTPDGIAFTQGDQAWSYAMLADRADALGCTLVTQGVTLGTVVALRGPRNAGLIIGLLGVWRAGGVLLALDPALPTARQQLMMQQAGATHLLHVGASDPGAVALDAGGAPVVALILDAQTGQVASALAAPDRTAAKLPALAPQDHAYVCFTSGTSGTPKAVLGTHAGLSHFLDWQRTSFAVTPADRSAQLTGLSFDVVLRDIGLPLTSGATLCLPDDNADRTADPVLAWFDRQRITLLHSVPTLAQTWLADGAMTGARPRLRWMFFAGEPLTDALVRRWRAACPGCGIANLYGPTETTLAKCCYVVPDDPVSGVQPVGWPLPHSQALVLAGERRCGIGEVGEIVIRTPFRSLGYLNAPAEMTARFVTNPFATNAERRTPNDGVTLSACHADWLYHTGDLGRYRHDGALAILGRCDAQLKLRGVRVEPDEVAAVLMRHPAVQVCAVVAQPDQRGDLALVAYVVMTNAERRTPNEADRDPPFVVRPSSLVGELRAFLSKQLPAALLPAAIIPLATLPRTANGKLDRRALPAPPWATEAGEQAVVAPRTPLEAQIAAIWAEVLGIEQLGVHDDFFALGGHSLRATQLVARLRAALACELTLADLFAAPTVAGLGALISQRGSAPEPATLPTLVLDPAQRHAPFPLTDIQQAYWIGRSGLLELGTVGTHGYLELDSEGLDLARLTRALRRLIARHPMLRAIVQPDGQQRVLAQVPPYIIMLLDLRALPEPARDAQLAAIRAQLSHQVLPSDRWPLFAIRATQLDTARTRLHISTDALISDAWSRHVLVRELALLYADPRASLPPLELTFRDYVLATQALQATAAYERAQVYWDTRLATLPPAPDLPLSKHPSAITQPRFSRRAAQLDAVIWQRLQARARQAGLTPSLVLLAALAEVLARWSARPRFTLNLTLFNRVPLHPQVDHLVGDFTTLTLLAVQHDPTVSFEARARRLQAQLWQDLEHRAVSGVAVLRALARMQGQAPRASMPVVFTSTLIHEATAPSADPLAGLGVVGYGISQTPQVWLDQQVSERGGVLYYNWDAVEELFPDGMLDDMFAAYTALLERLLDTEASWQTRELVSLPAAQLVQRAVVNATEAPLPDALLQDLVAAQVAQRPDAVALVAGRLRLSYSALWQHSTRLAQALRARGARRNTLIAVVMSGGWEQAVAVLAVLQSGAAYLPIDSELPQERLWSLLAHGQVELVLTQSWLDARLAWPPDVTRLCVDDARWKAGPSAPLDALQRSDDLAYVIYTSGSTGVPKGVMISHRAAVNTLVDINQRFGIGPGDRVLALSSLSFDLSVYDIFGTLAAGGAIVVPDATAGPDPAAWAALVVREQVTLWNTVPALLELLVGYVTPRPALWPRTLRLALLSGDWIPLALPDQIKTLADGIHVISLGGATEAAIWSIAYPIREIAPTWTSIPYGKPLANQTFHILNGWLEACPVWVVGELYIGGVGLAQGYLGRPDLTAERFVPNPFATPDAGRRTTNDEVEERSIVRRRSSFVRLYKTGDLGRYLPDGTIEFLGRADFQVKIQGYRIELGEIEAALTQHPIVRAAVVAAVGAARGPKRLVAYVVPIEDEGRRSKDEGRDTLSCVSTSELRTFLATRLPAYMVPSAFVMLDALPLSANGKVDRQALPAPEDGWRAVDDAPVAPSTPIEEVLTSIWGELLDVEQVGIHDDFFELGGHSLLAIRLIALVRDAFQLELPLRSLFETPNVAGLASTIAQLKGGQVEAEAAAARLPTIMPAPAQRHRPFGLTDVQQAYWIGRSEAFELGNVATHGYLEFESSALDIARFTSALQRLIARHDMLRAIILPDGRQQILVEVPPYQVAIMDLRGLDSCVAEAQLTTARRHLSHQVLPSDHWPLFEIRASLLKDQVTRLHISIDMLIADAWSSQILAREFAQLYQGGEVALAPLDLSFRDYVLAEAALADTEPYQRAQAYWRRRLLTLPPAPELPLAQHPSAISQPSFTRRTARLEPESWLQLKRRASRSGVTPSGVLLAAFATVLAVWSKSPHFTINLTLFNRLPLHPQVNDIVGDFTSLTLLAVEHDAELPFEARARRLQQQLWEDLDHRYVGGVAVLRELARVRGGATQALMPVVFTSTLIAGRADADAVSALPGEVVYSITQTSQVWLDHQVSERAGALVFNWDAVEELFPVGLLDAMFDAYCALLQRLVEEESSWRQTAPRLVPLAQLAQQSVANATAAPIPAGLLQTPFVAQVQQRPQQRAVIAAARSLTYAELYRRVNQVGRRLRQLGARPNMLVAVVMEKGWEQVVAVLGVLQAGAAYLPVDPALPLERVWYLLAHGQVELVLTQSWLDARLRWPDGIRRLSVDAMDTPQADGAPLYPPQQPMDLAYVIFTSGSTGVPKGVMIDHRGALNTVQDINARFAVGPADRVLALSALNFDLSVYDIFGTLAAGGTIIMPDASDDPDPAHWAALLGREQVTIWNTVPALLELLLTDNRRNTLPGSLRLVLLSGDWIPPSLPDQIKALVDGVAVISLGGATEASIWSILYPIGAVELGWTSIPYGKPMLNQTFHVLDAWLEPCPVWVPGQLYIGGVGLAQGYLGRPDLTAERFVPNPFATPDDEGRTTNDEGEERSIVVRPSSFVRLYKTGDLGRYLPDGNIEFLGRADFQVKVQGHRIELGEIEAVLTRHPIVRAAVVAAVGEPRGNKRLVAYVVASETMRDERRAINEPEINPNASSFILHPASLGSDPLERLRFKTRHAGLRQVHDRPAVQLVRPDVDEAAIEQQFIQRRSYRTYLQAPIPFERFSAFLSCLRQIDISGAPFPKYRYGSAGSLYPVQVYLYVKPGRVEGFAPGAYYYHPGQHSLVLLSDSADLDRSMHAPPNRALFDESAFTLLLVGQLDAITPMYGEESLRFALLEAGAMTQLLELSAPDQAIGLCQTGNIDFALIRDCFALEPGHVLLHGMVGGPIAAQQTSLPAWMAEVGGYGELIQLLDAQVPHPHEESRSTNGEGPDASFGRSSSPASELRSFLKERLPEYMIPSAFVLLDALPLTPNGKIDRQSLPLPEAARSAQDDAFVAPRTPIEEVLAGIWSDVLQLEQVDVHTSFFDLGGNSLQGTQIVARMRETFKVELPLRSLFEAPTVAGLAERVELACRGAAGLDRPPLRPGRTNELIPLSYAQQRLWFLDQLQPGGFAYNIQTAVRLTGALDIVALHQSLNEIVRRHEALRTIFTVVEERPIQIVTPAGAAPVTLLDLRSLAEPGREQQIRRGAIAEARRPFELSSGPLVRATLLRLHAREHVALLTMHHIAADGWSMGVLVRELTALYDAFSAGQAASLPPLPIQYADFALWQREWLKGDVLAAQLAYWKAQLADAGGHRGPALLELPTDHPRPAIQTFRGARQTLVLPRPLVDTLAALSRRESVTLFMALLAAFQTLLARYSGQNDIAVGSTISNRVVAETEPLIGFFVNTLVLRTDLSGNPTFPALLSRVREVCLGAYAHQDLPFEQLVEQLQPARDLSRQPLFQVMLILQNAPPLARAHADSSLARLEIAPLDIDSGTAKFDLTLSLQDDDEGLIGRLEYNTDLFESATIARMIGHLATLLQGIADRPERRVAELPLLTEAEWQELVAARNATSAAYPTDRCFHQLFAAQVARTPDAIALVANETEDAGRRTNPLNSSFVVRRASFGAHVTYRELNARANQLARHLRALGVGPDVRVGICLERSLDLLISLLGIFKAGGAFVPLDPAYPPERLAFILDDAQVPVLITDSRYDVRLTTDDLEESQTSIVNHSSKIVHLRADQPTIARQPDHDLGTHTRPENLAYMIYTSGSTGSPKGVLIPHRGLVNYLTWCAAAYNIAHGRGAPIQSTIAADAIISSLFAPLLVGTSVVLLPEEQPLVALHHALRLGGAFSMIKITPSQLEVLQHIGAADARDWTRAFVIGGEALRGEMLAFWQTHAPGTALFNEYGPTETVIGCGSYRVLAPLAGAVPIGLPIANMQFYVLDAHMQPVPIGVVGELYIGGAGVAWGYHNRPELTAERFVPNPFVDRRQADKQTSRQADKESGDATERQSAIGNRQSAMGTRLYRTGDRVRYLADHGSNIVFLGRADDQVKIRGYRVEPGEIMAVLARHPAVREAAVLARTSAPSASGDVELRLVAYVVPTKDESASSSFVVRRSPLASELRAFLKARLPDYMVPSAFVLLDALPLTPGGKLDRRALPDPDGHRAEQEVAYVPPRTELERMIAEVWQAALQIDQVGAHDNFFDLGGHSLLMVRVRSKLRDALQTDLSIVDMFTYPTINALAQHITQAQSKLPAFQARAERVELRSALVKSRRQLRRTHLAKQPQDEAEDE